MHLTPLLHLSKKKTPLLHMTWKVDAFLLVDSVKLIYTNSACLLNYLLRV
jgi:hypothetical protein